MSPSELPVDTTSGSNRTSGVKPRLLQVPPEGGPSLPPPLSPLGLLCWWHACAQCTCIKFFRAEAVPEACQSCRSLAPFPASLPGITLSRQGSLQGGACSAGQGSAGGNSPFFSDRPSGVGLSKWPVETPLLTPNHGMCLGAQILTSSREMLPIS